jgi:hypothetical protein
MRVREILGCFSGVGDLGFVKVKKGLFYFERGFYLEIGNL